MIVMMMWGGVMVMTMMCGFSLGHCAAKSKHGNYN
jgi:hypothetical protein